MSTIMHSRPGEHPEERADDRRLVTAFLSGSGAEVIGGIGAVTLAIIGLSNVAPGFMVTIATIVLGAAFLIEGGAVAAEYSDILDRTSHGTLVKAEWSGGMSMDMVAGAAGVVLGILALIGIAPQVLVGASVITFGAALAMSYGTVTRLNELRIDAEEELQPKVKRVAKQALLGAAGAQVLLGVGVIVLGILVLIDIAPMELSLIGLLVVGASLIISGSAVGGRFAGLFRR